MSFRLLPKSVTLNDLERRNGRYVALFQRIFVYDVAVKQLLGLRRFQNLLLMLYNRLLGEAIRTHHAATPRSSLVAGAGAYTVSPLCSDVPLSERHSSVLPRREHMSGSWR